MKLWKALLMAIFAVLLSLYARQLFQKPPEPELATDPVVFPNFNADSLSTLELVTPEHHLLFGQLNGVWTFLQPAGAPVKTRQLERALKTLSQMKIRGHFKPEEPLSAYGLQAPALRINLNGETETHSIQFGIKHPLTGRRYTLLDESREVMLVDDYDFETLKTLAQESAK